MKYVSLILLSCLLTACTSVKAPSETSSVSAPELQSAGTLTGTTPGAALAPQSSTGTR